MNPDAASHLRDHAASAVRLPNSRIRKNDVLARGIAHSRNARHCAGARLDQANGRLNALLALSSASDSGHSGSSDHSKTIMMDGGTPGTGLQPRTLEKCGAVKVFPVDIHVGN